MPISLCNQISSREYRFTGLVALLVACVLLAGCANNNTVNSHRRDSIISHTYGGVIVREAQLAEGIYVVWVRDMRDRHGYKKTDALLVSLADLTRQNGYERFVVIPFGYPLSEPRKYAEYRTRALAGEFSDSLRNPTFQVVKKKRCYNNVSCNEFYDISAKVVMFKGPEGRNIRTLDANKVYEKLTQRMQLKPRRPQVPFSGPPSR